MSPRPPAVGVRGGARALYGAYLKGLEACLAGNQLVDCPYEDKRKPSGKLSWSRAFINAWHAGWWDAKREREQALITLAYSGRGKRCAG